MLTEGISQFDKITIVPNMRAELIEKSKTCPLGLLLVGKHLPSANLPQRKTFPPVFWQEQGWWFEIL